MRSKDGHKLLNEVDLENFLKTIVSKYKDLVFHIQPSSEVSKTEFDLKQAMSEQLRASQDRVSTMTTHDIIY